MTTGRISKSFGVSNIYSTRYLDCSMFWLRKICSILFFLSDESLFFFETKIRKSKFWIFRRKSSKFENFRNFQIFDFVFQKISMTTGPFSKSFGVFNIYSTRSLDCAMFWLRKFCSIPFFFSDESLFFC